MEKKKKKINWAVIDRIVGTVLGVSYILFMLSIGFFMKMCIDDMRKNGLDYVSGDLLYAYENANTKETVSITGISEEGAKKEYIYFPSEIEGLPVTGVYKFVFGYTLSSNWNNAECKKIYMQENFQVMYSGIRRGCKNLEKIFIIEIGKNCGDLDKVLLQYDCYVASVMNPLIEHTVEKNNLTVYFANISYNFNYEDSPNYGIYFIDDCDYGSKIEYIPAEPKREGYTFDGWYKEPECINKWDFDADTLPEEIKEENENGEEEVKFQETKLYAKWK